MMFTNNEQDTTKRFWSDGFRARFYRKHAGTFFAKMHSAVADELSVVNPKDILDIGCGPGDLLAHFAQVFPDTNLTGTDLAPGMVAFANERLKGKAKVFEAKGAEMPFSNNSYDVVTITMAFHHFPRKLETLGLIKRVLRDGGMLVIADVVAQSNFMKKFWNILESITGRGFVEHYTQGEITALAEKAGLAITCKPIAGMGNRYRICMLKKT